MPLASLQPCSVPIGHHRCEVPQARNLPPPVDACSCLASQILGAAVAYHWPGISLPGRVALGPVHRHMGGSVWALGLATMATGITEKTTFVATAKKLAGDDLYGAIVRIPGAVLVLLALLGVTALYLQVETAHDSSGQGQG